MKIVAVTSCAGGIAHTYMAAEGLKMAAKAAGDEIKVEVQGSLGLENELSCAEIDKADFVIIAADIAVRNVERFSEKKIIEISPHDAIASAKSILSVLTLGAHQGALVTIYADGKDAPQALSALSDLVLNNFSDSETA